MLSAHDTQIAALWQLFDPIDFRQDDLNGTYRDWYGVPYSSFIQIELHQVKDCEDHRMTGECWQVLAMSNGNPLKLKGLYEPSSR